MAKLFGAQRMVLQAIQNSSKDGVGFVTDLRIAQVTKITIEVVRNWIETLEGKGLVEVARTEAGLSASITADGRLTLGLYQPFSTSPSNPNAKADSVASSLSPSGKRRAGFILVLGVILISLFGS